MIHPAYILHGKESLEEHHERIKPSWCKKSCVTSKTYCHCQFQYETWDQRWSELGSLRDHQKPWGQMGQTWPQHRWLHTSTSPRRDGSALRWFFGDHIAQRDDKVTRNPPGAHFFRWLSMAFSADQKKPWPKMSQPIFLVQDLDGFKGKMPKGQGAAAGGFGAAK